MLVIQLLVKSISHKFNCIGSFSLSSSTDNGSRPKSSEDTSRHVTITVTDTSEEHDPLSGDKQIHPTPGSPTSQTSEEGQWPLKRSQR